MARRSFPRLSLAALEDRWTPAAGDLDPTFGTGGLFTLPTAANTTVRPVAVATRPDGTVLTVATVSDLDPVTRQAVASGVAVFRQTADGRLDPTFDDDGRADLPLTAAIDVAVQPDGRVLVLGTNSPNTAETVVLRLTADGRPDPAYGAGGVASVVRGDALNVSQPATLAVRPDGRALVTTSTFQTRAPTIAAVSVFQFTADGQPDTGFHSALTGFPVGDLFQLTLTDTAPLADGGAVLVGSVATRTYQVTDKTGTRTAYDREAAVVRLTAAGNLDPTFGDGGRVRLAFGPTEGWQYSATGVTVRPDGRIELAGTALSPSFTQTGLTAVLTSAGKLDAGYDGDGLSAARSGTPYLLPDGSAVIVDPSPNDPGRGVTRLTPAGQVDPAFGSNGSAPLPFPLATGSQFYPSLGVTAAIARPDGTLVLAGFVVTDGQSSGTGTLIALQGSGPVGFAAAAPGAVQVGGPADGSAQQLVPSAAGYRVAGVNTFYPNFPGNVRTATADVTGDGVPDLIAGPGPGGGPNVVVLDGATGERFADLNAFESGFAGGVFVTAADLNGDGKAEVIVTPDQGGGPVVAVYDGARLAAGQNAGASLARFLGIEDAAFRGGARPAVADVNGDGTPDLVVAAGFGGGPRVAVYDGRTVLASGGQVPRRLVADFFVFEPTLRNGVYVTAADLTGDGAAEVVVGGGPGGGPRVFALDGKSLVAGRQTPVADFFAGDPDSRGGVRLAATGVNLVTGSGENQAASVRVYSPAAARTGGAASQTLAPFGGVMLADGVYVG